MYGYGRRVGLLAAAILLAAVSASRADSSRRSAYSYVRETEGQVTVQSDLNGSVDARRNLPISAGDEISTEDPARAEVSLADGNLLHVGGGTRVRFISLSGQQGTEDELSALDVVEGSVILSVTGNDDRSVPRIDTEDATVYANVGSRVRVNADPRHGTAVIVRAGSVEVKTRTGSYTVRAGSYLTVQEDTEPEIARGTFSHDRFDGWAADRIQVTYEAPRSASSDYVGEEDSGEVAGLEGYGDWDYNSTYGQYVWRPHVDMNWVPFGFGTWYYTPVGLTWWSYDPWGWYPSHYGTWFFDSGWNSWCWAPGSIYSPAWVYWAYAPGYVGWCPIGWYGFYSPWFDNYYKNWSYPRVGMNFAINGRFPTRRVDMRGWNFTGSTNLGTLTRVPIVSGTRVVERLGGQMSISSRPIVLNTRGGVTVRDALRDYVREAPRLIERTAGEDSSRLEPVLARDRQLPSASVEALRGRAVIAERGRLSGPGAADMAPRGVAVVERGQGAVHIERTTGAGRSSGRTTITDRGPADGGISRGRAPQSAVPAPLSDRGRARDSAVPQSRSETADSWRGDAKNAAPPEAGDSSGTSPSPRRHDDSVSEPWRGSPRSAPRSAAAPRVEAAAPRAETTPGRSGHDWRSRSDVPPARRVIDGAVPGRRPPESRDGQPSKDAPAPPQNAPAPRDAAPRNAPHSIDRGPGGPPPQAAPRDAPHPAPQSSPHESPHTGGSRPPATSGRSGRY